MDPHRCKEKFRPNNYLDITGSYKQKEWWILRDGVHGKRNLKELKFRDGSSKTLSQIRSRNWIYEKQISRQQEILGYPEKTDTWSVGWQMVWWMLWPRKRGGKGFSSGCFYKVFFFLAKGITPNLPGFHCILGVWTLSIIKIFPLLIGKKNKDKVRRCACRNLFKKTCIYSDV